MSSKIRVGVLFGGHSAEHEISLLSAKSVIEAMDKDKYEIVLIGIHKSGEWFLHEDLNQILDSHDPKRVHLKKVDNNVALVKKEKGDPLVSLSGRSLDRSIDVVFPVLHGTFGEDGTVQGLFKLANIPFVGAGVLGSAIGMDKDVMKRLLRDAGIPVAKFLSFNQLKIRKTNFEAISQALGLPFFVKPANTGSSVGISKVKTKADFMPAVKQAFQFDRKIIIEECIVGRELECSVLGNDEPMASVVGEVIPQHEFYSYEAKYLDEAGALLEIPARITEQESNDVRALALKAYQVLCCEGMARVDVFLKKDGQVFLNEINTIPGFTKISMYPKLWALSGLEYPKLIDRLIELAFERFEKESVLQISPMVMNEKPVLTDLE